MRKVSHVRLPERQRRGEWQHRVPGPFRRRARLKGVGPCTLRTPSTRPSGGPLAPADCGGHPGGKQGACSRQEAVEARDPEGMGRGLGGAPGGAGAWRILEDAHRWKGGTRGQR